MLAIDDEAPADGRQLQCGSSSRRIVGNFEMVLGRRRLELFLACQRSKVISPLDIMSRMSVGARRDLRSGFLLTCVSLVIFTSGAQSQTAKMVGLGATGCTQFSADADRTPAVQRDCLAWAQGFMSGILLSRPPGIDDKLDLNPPTFPLLKQLELLRRRCSEMPSEDFADAVEALYKRLRQEGAT